MNKVFTSFLFCCCCLFIGSLGSGFLEKNQIKVYAHNNSNKHVHPCTDDNVFNIPSVINLKTLNSLTTGNNPDKNHTTPVL